MAFAYRHHPDEAAGKVMADVEIGITAIAASAIGVLEGVRLAVAVGAVADTVRILVVRRNQQAGVRVRRRPAWNASRSLFPW